LDAVDVLKGVEGISFVKFDERDVVRHPLVQRIVKAYERYNETSGAGRQLSLKLTDSPLDAAVETPPVEAAQPVNVAPPLMAVAETTPVLNA
jgi:phosphate starvation-inducible PhoH-like protein